MPTTKFIATDSWYERDGSSWYSPFNSYYLATGDNGSGVEYKARFKFDWASIRSTYADYKMTSAKFYYYRTDTYSEKEIKIQCTDSSDTKVGNAVAQTSSSGKGWKYIYLDGTGGDDDIRTTLGSSTSVSYLETYNTTNDNYLEMYADTKDGYEPYLLFTWELRNTAPTNPSNCLIASTGYGYDYGTSAYNHVGSTGSVTLSTSGSTDAEGDTIYYEFSYRPTTAEDYTVFRSWSTSKTATFNFSTYSVPAGVITYFRVRAKDSNDATSGYTYASNSADKQCAYLMAKLATPTTCTVASTGFTDPSGNVGTNGAVTLSWSAVSSKHSGAVTYQWEYYNGSAWVTATTSSTSVSFTPSNTTGYLYQLRVKATEYGNPNNSDYKTADKKVYKLITPSAPETLSVASTGIIDSSGRIGAITNVALACTTVASPHGGAMLYQFEYSTSVNGTYTAFRTYNTTTAANFTFSSYSIAANTPIYFRVLAKETGGNTSAATKWTTGAFLIDLTSKNPSSAPTVPSSSVSTATEITTSWGAAAHGLTVASPASITTEYNVQLYDPSTSSWIAINTSATSNSQTFKPSTVLGISDTQIYNQSGCMIRVTASYVVTLNSSYSAASKPYVSAWVNSSTFTIGTPSDLQINSFTVDTSLYEGQSYTVSGLNLSRVITTDTNGNELLYTYTIQLLDSSNVLLSTIASGTNVSWSTLQAVSATFVTPSVATTNDVSAKVQLKITDTSSALKTLANSVLIKRYRSPSFSFGAITRNATSFSVAITITDTGLNGKTVDISSLINLTGGSTYKFPKTANNVSITSLTSGSFIVSLTNDTSSGAVAITEATSGYLSVTIANKPSGVTAKTNTLTLYIPAYMPPLRLEPKSGNIRVKGSYYSEGLSYNRALAVDASGKIVASAVTDTQLGYLSTTTSDVQTQLNNRLLLSGGKLTGNLIIQDNNLRFIRSTASASSVSTQGLQIYDTDSSVYKGALFYNFNTSRWRLTDDGTNYCYLWHEGVQNISTVTGVATPTSTGHALQIGPTSGRNLRLSIYDVMSVNNGGLAALHLNRFGGGITSGAYNADRTDQGWDDCSMTVHGSLIARRYSLSTAWTGLTMDAPAGYNRLLTFRTYIPPAAGNPWSAGTFASRWSIFTSSDAESGSNAGSNFRIYSYNDAGSYLSNPLSIERSTNLMTINALYATGNVSALSFTDRTPFYEGDALAEISAISGDGNGGIDHSTLPEFARVRLNNGNKIANTESEPQGQMRMSMMSLTPEETVESTTNEEIEEGRDIGAMVTMLTVAVQQLNVQMAEIRARLDALEK